METVVFWMGKPVTELTKEELIEALSWCGREIERLYKQNEHDRVFLMDLLIPNRLANEP